MGRIVIPAVILLAANAVTDIRKKEILLIPTCVSAAAGAVLRIASSGVFPAETVIPGAGMLLLSALSRGKIGAGDGIVLVALGIWTGFTEAAVTCTAGLFLASCYTLIVLARRSGESEIPLIPFLLAGYLLQSRWGWKFHIP